MTTIVAHGATPLPDAIPALAVFHPKNWLKQYLKAFNGELIEGVFVWFAESSIKLLMTLGAIIIEAANWFEGG